MYQLSPLPYAYGALEPTVSERTLRHHHDKHHAKYVSTLNSLLNDDPAAGDRPLEQLIGQAREARETMVFNQAAQVWNHGFFWECMTPQFRPVQGGLAEAIQRSFDSLEGLRTAFVREGVGHFASGWVWLVAERDQLKPVATHDADTLADREGCAPVLVADLWEHAYYLDYQQDREAFLRAWFDRVVNWAFAEAQFDAAASGGTAYRYPAPERRAA